MKRITWFIGKLVTAWHYMNRKPVRVAPKQFTKVYKGNPKRITWLYNVDVARMAKLGYDPVDTNGFNGHRGGFGTAAGIAALGVGFLVVRPKDNLIVTYKKREEHSS